MKLFVNKNGKIAKKKTLLSKAYSKVESPFASLKQFQKIKKKFVRKVEVNDDLNKSIDNSLDFQDEEFRLKSSRSKMTNPYETKYFYEKSQKKMKEED